MVSVEDRIAVAAAAVFVSLTGVAAAIHVLMFDQSSANRYGEAAIMIGVVGFAVLLNLTPKDGRAKRGTLRMA
ncbi:hypothetical protein AWB81_04703 [Caballeronia arationis]|uniref:DUF2964 family protein n=1 Tax=Caballeronia arationis TaxID=1777142 RepID=UPI00074CE314|nr:DUF2964 family protein [Caballeronia arationis]SAK88976.1 hypothetical protein AWB81_04703 [Caballeronia arationis]